MDEEKKEKSRQSPLSVSEISAMLKNARKTYLRQSADNQLNEGKQPIPNFGFGIIIKKRPPPPENRSQCDSASDLRKGYLSEFGTSRMGFRPFERRIKVNQHQH